MLIVQPMCWFISGYSNTSCLLKAGSPSQGYRPIALAPSTLLNRAVVVRWIPGLPQQTAGLQMVKISRRNSEYTLRLISCLRSGLTTRSGATSPGPRHPYGTKPRPNRSCSLSRVPSTSYSIHIKSLASDGRHSTPLATKISVFVL